MADIEKQKAFEFVNWLLLPHFPCAKTQSVSMLALSVDRWLKNRGCSLNKVGRNLANVLSLPTNADTSATQALSTHPRVERPSGGASHGGPGVGKQLHPHERIVTDHRHGKAHRLARRMALTSPVQDRSPYQNKQNSHKHHKYRSSATHN